MLSDGYQAQTTYLDVKIANTTQEEAVVLLFEGMVRLLRQAHEAMQHKQYERQSHLIGKVQRILTELTCALDDSRDETLAAALRWTYTQMCNQLTEANIKDDMHLLDEVADMTARLAKSWREAFENVANDSQQRVAAAG